MQMNQQGPTSPLERMQDSDEDIQRDADTPFDIDPPNQPQSHDQPGPNSHCSSQSAQQQGQQLSDNPPSPSQYIQQVSVKVRYPHHHHHDHHPAAHNNEESSGRNPDHNRSQPVPAEHRDSSISYLKSKLGTLQEREQRLEKILQNNAALETYEKLWADLPRVATARSQENIHTGHRHDYEAKIRAKDRLLIKQIPDFQSLHQRMDERLAAKKRQFKPTEIQQFRFHQCHKHEHPVQVNSTRKIHTSPSERELSSIYLTKKHLDLVNLRQQTEKAKQEQQRLKEIEDIEREERHKQFAKYIRKGFKKLRSHDQKLKSMIERKKLFSKSSTSKDLGPVDSHLHEDNLRRIYSKVVKKPFLFEREIQKTPTIQQEYYAQGRPDQKKAKHTRKPAQKP